MKGTSFHDFAPGFQRPEFDIGEAGFYSCPSQLAMWTPRHELATIDVDRALLAP